MGAAGGDGPIAFVGLGRMGAPMAANLAAAGHPVRGFDVVPAALDAAAAKGIEPATSAADAARGAAVVITMLPSGADLLDAYGAGGELLATAEPGALMVDCSTIDIDSTQRARELAAAKGLDFVDAPVSGGVVGATAATLTFMVGGTPASFERARPLLEAMGRSIVHCGPVGTGQAAKICNNMILGATMVAVSEGFVLGESLGLSHDVLYEVTSQSSAQCWSLTVHCPVPGQVPASPANRDYAAGFMTDHMIKDLRLARDAAAGRAATDLCSSALDAYERLAEQRGGEIDFSAVILGIRARGNDEHRSPAGGG